MSINITKNVKKEPAASGESRWFLFFYWATFYLLLLSIFFIKSASELDPDLGWHLRIGKEISLERQVPTIEDITYPTLGQHWVDHEWLSNLLLYELYSLGGSYGHWILSIVFSSLLLATFHFSIRATRKYLLAKTPPLQSAFLISLAVLASLYPILIFFGNRVQVLSWFMLSLSFFLFAKIFVDKRYNLLFAFPLLFAVWANLHGSFIFGLGALTTFCILLFWHAKERRRRLLVISALASSFAATLLTPYHIELWKLVAIEYMSNRSYLKNIAEWQPIYYVFRILWIPSLYIAVFIVLLILSKPKKLLQSRGLSCYLAFSLLTLLLAIKARRFIPFFAFSSLPLLALFLRNILPGKFPMRKILPLLLLPLAFALIYSHSAKSPLPKDIFSVQSYVSPKNAVSFIRSNSNLEKLKIFNDYNWGGYLTWVWPQKQIFIDGRMPQRPLAKNLTFFEEYLKFHQEDALESKLDEYSIEMVLIQNKKAVEFKSKAEKFLYEKFFFLTEEDFQQDHLLVDHLENNWVKAYEDPESLIFIRPDILEKEMELLKKSS